MEGVTGQHNNRPRQLARAAALYDIAVGLPFVLPWTAYPFLKFMNEIAVVIGYPGTLTDFSPFEILFVNMFGVFLLVRARCADGNHQQRWALNDAYVRLGVSLLLFHNVVAEGGNAVTMFFLVLEIAWGVSDWWAWRNWRTLGAVAQAA